VVGQGDRTAQDGHRPSRPGVCRSRAAEIRASRGARRKGHARPGEPGRAQSGVPLAGDGRADPLPVRDLQVIGEPSRREVTHQAVCQAGRSSAERAGGLT
jgi:hypothetical protein